MKTLIGEKIASGLYIVIFSVILVGFFCILGITMGEFASGVDELEEIIIAEK